MKLAGSSETWQKSENDKESRMFQEDGTDKRSRILQESRTDKEMKILRKSRYVKKGWYRYMKCRQVIMGIICGMVIMGMPMAALADTENDSFFETPENLPESRLVRNAAGDIVGVDRTAEVVEDDTERREVDIEELQKCSQFAEYEKLGLTYSEEDGKLHFAGRKVWALCDEYEENAILNFTDDELMPFMIDEVIDEMIDEEVISIVAVRDENYHLLYFNFWRDAEYMFSDEIEEDTAEASSISIIGGADGPTSIFLAGKLGDMGDGETEED